MQRGRRSKAGKAGRGLASVLRDPEARDTAWGEAGHAEQWAKGDRKRGEDESDLVSHGRGRTGKTRSTRNSQRRCASWTVGAQTRAAAVGNSVRESCAVKKLKLELLCDPAISILCIYPQEEKTVA